MIGNIRIDRHGRRWRTIGASDDTIIEEPVLPAAESSDVKDDNSKKDNLNDIDPPVERIKYTSIRRIDYEDYCLYDKRGMIVKQRIACNLYDNKV